MRFNNRIPLLCYRRTVGWGDGGMERDTESQQVRERCSGGFYLFFPSDWIQFSSFQLIKTQRMELRDACWICRHIMIMSCTQFLSKRQLLLSCSPLPPLHHEPHFLFILQRTWRVWYLAFQPTPAFNLVYFKACSTLCKSAVWWKPHSSRGFSPPSVSGPL